MTTSSHDYDVAIIGYGPVGVTAANLLGGMGLRVLVAERDTDIYARARAISTDEEILRIWQRIGLAERLKQDMLTDKPIDFVDAQGDSFLSFTPKTRGNGHPVQLFIYQPALEEVLREGVKRYPDVEVRLGAEVVRQTQDADGVDLAVLDLASDRISRARAQYVIAADGGSSPTRGQLGIGFEGTTFEDKWVVIDTSVLREWPEVDRLRFHCNPARPAVDCPTPLGHHRWEFPVLPADDAAELVTETAVRRLLHDQGIDDDQVEVLRAVVYSHHVRFAAKWRAGRIFLAGDAAHVMPPWIGQGMASGVRDVNNLCWKLAGVIRGELPDEVLDTYETERMPHVRAITRAAVFFGRVITERRRAVTRFRDPVFRTLMGLPFVGDFLRDGGWFPDTRYDAGYLDRPRSRGHRRAASAVGRCVPQPFVLSPAGDRERLDDVIAGKAEDAAGSGWAVLRLGPTDPGARWAAAGVSSFEVRGPGAAPAPGAVVDVHGVLTAWMHRHRVHAVVVRPDGVVHSVAARDLPLPAPAVSLPAESPALRMEGAS